MRRLTRLTNAFSKKWVNMRTAMALQFALYNFCRKHITLKGATLRWQPGFLIEFGR